MCQARPIYHTTVPPVGGCFVAGTLVHTKNGLVPIEKIRVGDWLLSQPEMKGERAYRQVVKTFAIEEQQEVFLLEYFRDHDKTARTLVVTGHHPFWAKNVGWTAADDLRPGRVLELHDGAEARVFNVRKILKIDIPDVGWTHDDGGEVGPTIDMRDGSIQVEPNSFNSSAFEIDEYLKRAVFNIEVEGFHTYYVGEVGVLVHDTDCRVKEAP
jgi:hypothetical protein